MQAEKVQCLKTSFKELTYLGYHMVRHTRNHKGYKPFLRPLPGISQSRPPLPSFNHMKCKYQPIPSYLPTAILSFTKPQLLLASLLLCELGVTALKTPNIYRASVHSTRLLSARGLTAAREHPFSRKGTPHSLSAFPWGQGCTWNRNCVRVFFVMLAPWHYVISFAAFDIWSNSRSDFSIPPPRRKRVRKWINIEEQKTGRNVPCSLNSWHVFQLPSSLMAYGYTWTWE